MPFELFADVILTRDVADRGLRAGDVGGLSNAIPRPA
jgi:hypothetical protein